MLNIASNSQPDAPILVPPDEILQQLNVMWMNTYVLTISTLLDVENLVQVNRRRKLPQNRGNRWRWWSNNRMRYWIDRFTRITDRLLGIDPSSLAPPTSLSASLSPILPLDAAEIDSSFGLEATASELAESVQPELVSQNQETQEPTQILP